MNVPSNTRTHIKPTMNVPSNNLKPTIDVLLLAATSSLTDSKLAVIEPPLVRTDRDLKDLVLLLNTAPLDILPEKMSTMAQFEAFMLHLTPWIIGEPVEPLLFESRPNPLTLNCRDKRYGSVLSGELRGKPIPIIDVINVGSDLDILEIRLLDTFDVVRMI